MRKVVLFLLSLPLFAGSLILEVGNPKANPEASKKGAVLVARVTACHDPAKAVVTATAEGIVDGKRRSIPLHVIHLSTPGSFAVTREWPRQGSWVVRMVLTHPEYGDYTSAILTPIHNDRFDWGSVRRLYRNPTPEDIDAALAQNNL